MIDATIKMSVPADKRVEVLQTIKTLIGPIRDQPGCLSCYYCVDAEEDRIVIFRQEWQTDEDLAAHLKSEHFTVLLGVMKLLSIEPEIMFSTIASRAGAEVITKTRAR